MNYVIAIIIGIIAGFVIAGIQKSALTSVTMQKAAADYIKQNSLRFSVKTDQFLYKKIEKEEKPKK